MAGVPIAERLHHRSDIVARAGQPLADGGARVERAVPGHLIGDATKAREVLGWVPRSTFREIVCEMVRADLDAVLAERIGNARNV